MENCNCRNSCNIFDLYGCLNVLGTYQLFGLLSTNYIKIHIDYDKERYMPRFLNGRHSVYINSNFRFFFATRKIHTIRIKPVTIGQELTLFFCTHDLYD